MSNSLRSTLKHVTQRKLSNLQAQKVRLTQLCGSVTHTDEIDNASTTLEALLGVFENLGDAEECFTSPLHVDLSPRLVKELHQQTQYDRTISPSVIRGWCDLLKRALEERSRQIEHAILYGRLVMEWVHDNEQELQDSEVLVRDALREQRQEWEALAFREDPVNAESLAAYLESIFAPSKKPLKAGAHSALDQLRERTEDYSKVFARFDERCVSDAIDSVLSNDLYAGEKRANLRDLKAHRNVLREIADILNQDLDSLESWHWADGGVQLSMRRHINGKYRVYMDEQMYQAIFLAHIGTAWSNHFHGAFMHFFDATWRHGARCQPTKEEQRYRNSRLHVIHESFEAEQNGSVSNLRKTQYKDVFWMAAISPKTRKSLARGYGDDGGGEADIDGRNAQGDYYSFVDIKQQLLRLITTESLIQKDVYGQFTVLQSDFRWFGPSLSHTTILTVLNFFGVSQKWLTFFGKFLSPTLYFASDGAEAIGRRRTCGTPIAHQLSTLFGEVVMFALDFAVNHATEGGYLYRIHDDLWFWGQPDRCVAAWKTLQTFCASAGLTLNMDKTAAVTLRGTPAAILQGDGKAEASIGSASTDGQGEEPDTTLPWNPIRWGFLVLSAQEGQWRIDRQLLDEHVEEMRLQLDATNCMMSWVRVWNSYVSSFFVNNFGKPARCLGQDHVKMCMRAFETVQNHLLQAYGGNHANLIEFVAETMVQRFGKQTAMWESLIYFPTELGGMALHNPLIELNANLASEHKNPHEIVQAAWYASHDRYEGLVQRWERAESRFATNRDTFLTFQQFMRHAEETERALRGAYLDLLGDLKADNQHVATRNMLNGRNLPGALRYMDAAAKSRSPLYWKRILQLYGAATIEYYGSLVMAPARFMPMGVITYLSSEKIRWQK